MAQSSAKRTGSIDNTGAGPSAEGLAEHQLQLLDSLSEGVVEFMRIVQDLDSKDSITSRSLFLSDDPSMIRMRVESGTHVLLNMPLQVKERLIRGTLLDNPQMMTHLPQQVRMFTEPPLGRTSVEDQGPYQYRPVIYGLFFVDQSGAPPIVDDLQLVVDQLASYAMHPDELSNLDRSDRKEKEAFAMKVDSWKRNGLDKFLQEKEIDEGARRYLPRDTNYERAREWIEVTNERLEKLADKSKHLPWCPASVGYTYNPASRKKSHSDHSSSNHLMNLVESIAQALWRGRYSMKWTILYECFHYRQAGVAEHLISWACSSYIHLGGFNGQCAGLSNESAVHIEVWLYNLLEREAYQRGVFSNALELEISKQNQRRAELKSLQKKEKELDEILTKLKEQEKKVFEKLNEEATQELEQLKSLGRFLDRVESTLDDAMDEGK
ncbi:MAG: hypothetical protein Q9165_001045 [Trypethelium subeluteriae]